MELLSGLLPQASVLHLETWPIDTATAQVTLRVQSTQTLVHCPVCQCPTQRIHRCYRRTVADLPWAHYRVVLQLSVRKFFCANGRCLRHIFTERQPGPLGPAAVAPSCACSAGCRSRPLRVPPSSAWTISRCGNVSAMARS